MNDTNSNSGQTGRRSIITVVIAVSSSCVIWTVCANLVILVCHYRNRRRPWTTFSRLSCSMCISDLLVACVWLPTLLGAKVNAPVCLVLIYLITSIQSVSIFHVLGICILRNIKLKRSHVNVTGRSPLKYTIYIAASSWCIPLTAILVPILFWSNISNTETQCNIKAIFGESSIQFTTYFSGFLFVSQSLTNIIYLVTVLRMWLNNRKRILPHTPEPNNSHSNLASDQKRSIGKTSRQCVDHLNPNTETSLAQLVSSTHRTYPIGNTRWARSDPDKCTQPKSGTSREDQFANTAKVDNLTRKSGTDSTNNVPGTNNTSASSTTIETISNSRARHQRIKQSEAVMHSSAPATFAVKHQKRMIGTIGILLLLFNIFTIPVPTIGLCMALGVPINLNIMFIANTMFILNSGLNPIVYATRITSLRVAIKQLFFDILKVLHLRRDN